jgi:hypothetical protein
LVDTKSYLLGGSQEEVLELGPIEDEEDHGEHDAYDLDNEEYHDALGCQSSHVVQETHLYGHIAEEDEDIDVAIASIEGVDKGFHDDDVYEGLGDELEHL